MASVLSFERYAADLNRQLLRRIGYTNGLHKIRRFARVVEYVYPIMPTSARQLAQIIITEENKRAADKETQLRGADYASGIIDVAKALLLLERFGPKIALSSQGYACHALVQTGCEQNVIDSFLFHKTIEADGEYTLNILRLVSEGLSGVMRLGEALRERFIALIRFKRQWAERIPNRFSQRTLVGMLDDAQRTFEKAVSKDANLVEFFYKHTINPRLEWLEDFGCIASAKAAGLECTEKGARVLAGVKELGGWNEQFIFLPVDKWLASELELPRLSLASEEDEFAWRIVAAGMAQRITEHPLGDARRLLTEIKSVYPFVKLANFNEADALSLYEVMAAKAVVKGTVVSLSGFERTLDQLAREFPKEIFRLSKRRGRGLYIALKKSA